VDKTLHKNTQYGLDNTMIDLIYNLFGSLIAVVLGWVYLKVAPRKERQQLADASRRYDPAAFRRHSWERRRRPRTQHIVNFT